MLLDQPRSVRSGILLLVLIFAYAWAFAGPARAQEGGGVVLTPGGQVTSGALEFRRYCAQCHGVSGKGDGPVAEALKERPKDLTVLSKNNGGNFPYKHVYNTITGAETIAAHGTREMPIWGLVFSQTNRPVLGAGGTLHRSPEREKAEINLIIDYIKSLQVK